MKISACISLVLVQIHHTVKRRSDTSAFVCLFVCLSHNHFLYQHFQSHLPSLLCLFVHRFLFLSDGPVCLEGLCFLIQSPHFLFTCLWSHIYGSVCTAEQIWIGDSVLITTCHPVQYTLPAVVHTHTHTHSKTCSDWEKQRRSRR